MNPRPPSLPVLLLIVLVAGCATPPRPPEMPWPHPTLDGRPPLVIAHRGASGHRPEHTLEAYRLAIELGADYIEPDLVITRDGVLVARHENELSDTTDVAARPEFAARRTKKRIDGAEVTGWFSEDFTLAELKTLRARERLPELRPGNTAWDGRFTVPTFEEVLDLAAAESRRLGRTIGVYPETKHPSYFRALGLPLEEPLVAALAARGFTGPDAPVFIQSFEVGNLRRLRGLTGVRLIQLVAPRGAPPDLAAAGDPRTYADLVTPAGLREVAGYAAGLGVHKDLVLPHDAGRQLQAATSLVADAHATGLPVHVWTFRDENAFLPADFQDNPAGELRAFLALGVDGVFTDFPGTAVQVVNETTAAGR